MYITFSCDGGYNTGAGKKEGRITCDDGVLVSDECKPLSCKVSKHYGLSTKAYKPGQWKDELQSGDSMVALCEDDHVPVEKIADPKSPGGWRVEKKDLIKCHLGVLTEFKCEPKCSIPHVLLENTKRIRGPGWKEKLTDGEFNTFTCQDGFMPQYDNKIKCISGILMSNPHACVKDDNATKCGPKYEGVVCKDPSKPFCSMKSKDGEGVCVEDEYTDEFRTRVPVNKFTTQFDYNKTGSAQTPRRPPTGVCGPKWDGDYKATCQDPKKPFCIQPSTSGDGDGGRCENEFMKSWWMENKYLKDPDKYKEYNYTETLIRSTPMPVQRSDLRCGPDSLTKSVCRTREKPYCSYTGWCNSRYINPETTAYDYVA